MTLRWLLRQRYCTLISCQVSTFPRNTWPLCSCPFFFPRHSMCCPPPFVHAENEAFRPTQITIGGVPSVIMEPVSPPCSTLRLEQALMRNIRKCSREEMLSMWMGQLQRLPLCELRETYCNLFMTTDITRSPRERKLTAWPLHSISSLSLR